MAVVTCLKVNEKFSQPGPIRNHVTGFQGTKGAPLSCFRCSWLADAKAVGAWGSFLLANFGAQQQSVSAVMFTLLMTHAGLEPEALVQPSMWSLGRRRFESPGQKSLRGSWEWTRRHAVV